MIDYTEAQKIERANRAKVLLNDDLFAEMLTEVRMDALNALSETPADDPNEIRRLQALVQVTGEIKDRLEAAIIATGELDGGLDTQASRT